MQEKSRPKPSSEKPIQGSVLLHGHYRSYSKCQKFCPIFPENPLFTNNPQFLFLLGRSCFLMSLSSQFCERNGVSLASGEEGSDGKFAFLGQLIAVALRELSDKAVGTQEAYLASDAA